MKFSVCSLSSILLLKFLNSSQNGCQSEIIFDVFIQLINMRSNCSDVLLSSIIPGFAAAMLMVVPRKIAWFPVLVPIHRQLWIYYFQLITCLPETLSQHYSQQKTADDTYCNGEIGIIGDEGNCR